MKQITFFIFFSFIFSMPVSILAVEVAPRISDREIIEKLAGLEAGQAALGKRMDDMNVTMLTLFSTMVALILALFAYIASGTAAQCLNQ